MVTHVPHFPSGENKVFKSLFKVQEGQVLFLPQPARMAGCHPVLGVALPVSVCFQFHLLAGVVLGRLMLRSLLMFVELLAVSTWAGSLQYQ